MIVTTMTESKEPIHPNQPTLYCYNGEKYERKPLWYVMAIILYGAVIISSVITDNLFGVVLLVLFLGWYLYYNFIDIYKTVSIVVYPEWLLIDKKMIAWQEVTWCGIEYDLKTNQAMTIVLKIKKQYMIFSLQSSQDEIDSFMSILLSIVPKLEALELSTLEKWTRKLMI
jgi:hypothetical protein